MVFLLLLEALLFVAGLLYVWRRARAATPPFGAPLGWIALALLVHSSLLAGTYIYLDSVSQEPDTFARQLPRAMWFIWILQFARAAAMLFALGAWFRIVKEQLRGKWLGGMFVIASVLFAIPDSFPQVLGFVLMFIVLARLKWSNELHGLVRFSVLACSGLFLLLLSFDVTARVTVTGFSISVLGLGNSPDQSILVPPIPDAQTFVYGLTSVWDRGISVLAAIIRLIALIAFFKLLVVPVRLRGLSLKRRFTMTFVLFRIIPGLLGLVATLLIIYFGVGWQKARMAKMMFEDTLSRNMMAAESILDRIAPVIEQDSFDTSPPPVAAVRRWLGPDSSRAHFVIRRFTPPTGTSGSSAPIPAYEPRSTPGTPADIVSQSLLQSLDSDSIAGFYAVKGILYLAAARMRPDRRASSEVYVVVDSLFLRRIMEHIAADIKLVARPSLFITATTITSSEDSIWTDRAIEIDVSEQIDSGSIGFLRDRHYLARTFLPVGNWLELRGDTPAGVVSLALYTSIERIFAKLAGEPYFFSSNSIPILMLGFILFLFLIAEISAVRTGQSIARGILDDVKLLASATRRFGEGDLGHRIPVHGSDELSTLATSFNTMAVDIQNHQAVLLEKERLEADLAVAREIQQRMLPQEPPVVSGLDVAGISIPSREVGGDLFSFLTLPNGSLGFALGDVSGKSVPAALLMSNTVAALKAETRVDAAVDHVLDQMNKLIADQVEPGKFVTFFYGIVDQEDGVINYSCAGHNPPLKISAAGESAWISEAGLPLGVSHDAEYTASSVPFQPGDIFVLYSDGVTEAERDPGTSHPPAPGDMDETTDKNNDDEEFFGENRLEEVIRSARHSSASDIIESLLDAIRRYSGDTPQSDDITIIVVKYMEKPKAP